MVDQRGKKPLSLFVALKKRKLGKISKEVSNIEHFIHPNVFRASVRDKTETQRVK